MKWLPKRSYPIFPSSPLVFKSRLHTNTWYFLAPSWGIICSSSYVAAVKKQPQGPLCATAESERSLTKIKFITLHLSVRPGTRLMDSRCFIAPWLLRVTLLFDRSLSIIQNQQKNGDLVRVFLALINTGNSVKSSFQNTFVFLFWPPFIVNLCSDWFCQQNKASDL